MYPYVHIPKWRMSMPQISPSSLYMQPFNHSLLHDGIFAPSMLFQTLPPQPNAMLVKLSIYKGYQSQSALTSH